MSKKRILMILLTLLLWIPLCVYADFPAEISGSGVNFRKGPGKNYESYGTLSKGTSINVPDKTLYEGSGCSAKWYKVTYGGKTGYVCSTYVAFVNAATSINPQSYTARINSNNVSARSGASTSKSVQDTLSLGVNVKILQSVSASNSGCDGNVWYKVLYYNSKTGYVCAKYVTKYEDITLYDSEYYQELKAAGFPDSYIPYLTYLHNKYPNWVFQAKNTRLDFATSVSKEQGVNYMQTTNNAYRTSTTPAEGSSWYKVNKGVIGFYMDPRNWLTEERIFMFEKLDYDASFDAKYPQLVKTVFGDGRLSADTYTIPIYNMGKKYGVSPLHLASRIRLEVGKNGSDSTNGTSFTYKGVTYSGYYNFFNIGAYEQTIDGVHYSAVTMGLVTAMNRGWDTIEKAIEYGAKFIANGYVTEGQGTIYYQKFNVNPNTTSTKFSHQYMTNIQAPATESSQTYSSYKKGGILAESFIFEIPVYNNMPEYTSLPDATNLGEESNYLGNLTIDDFNVVFNQKVQKYIVHVNEDTTSVNIVATPQNEDATVTGAGTINLTGEKTTVTINVTTTSTRNYTVTLVKPVPEEVVPEPDPGPTTPHTTDSIITSAGYKIKNNYIYNFAIGTNTNTVINKLQSEDTTVTIFNSNNQVKNNATLVTGDKIKVNEDIYTVIIYGDVNGDGQVTILDLSLIQMHLLNKQSLNGVYTQAADTSKNNKIDILDLSLVQMHLLNKSKLSQS